MSVRLDPQACRTLVASDRWLGKVDKSGDCWLWLGCCVTGYGQISHAGRMLFAHRVSLVAALGRDIGTGMQVSHDCHDAAATAGTCVPLPGEGCAHRRCVNPAHLSEKTALENVAASPLTQVGDRLRRTHCPRGHPLSPGNLVPNDAARGHRSCLKCHRSHSLERGAILRDAAHSLGLSRRGYVALYGYSKATALAVLDDTFRTEWMVAR